MDWEKKAILFGILWFFVTGSVWAANGCTQLDRTQEPIELGGGRKLKIIEQTIVDNAGQSTLRQKLLVDGNRPLTQEDARAFMDEMFVRAKASCRKYPLKGTLIFLYGNKEAVVGTNWLARLDTDDGTRPVIDLQDELFEGTATKSICEVPSSPKPVKEKRDPFPGEVRLPPINQRKALGTWAPVRLIGATCNRSYEEVKGRVYEVIRCSDCSGGKFGKPLIKSASGTFTRPDRRNGEYFKILPNGNLSSFDREGLIDSYPKLPNLWPQHR